MVGLLDWPYLLVTGKSCSLFGNHYNSICSSRFLHINVRPWSLRYKESMTSVVSPPPVGSRIDCHVLDLGRMAFVGKKATIQTGFVSSDPCPWTDLKVTKHYICHGNVETNKAGIWDRHYGVQVAAFDHADRINAIAINPVNEDMAVTVGEDMKAIVWRSKDLSNKIKQKKELEES